MKEQKKTKNIFNLVYLNLFMDEVYEGTEQLTEKHSEIVKAVSDRKNPSEILKLFYDYRDLILGRLQRYYNFQAKYNMNDTRMIEYFNHLNMDLYKMKEMDELYLKNANLVIEEYEELLTLEEAA